MSKPSINIFNKSLFPATSESRPRQKPGSNYRDRDPGASAEYSVALGTAPFENVSIEFSSTDETEGKVQASSRVLTFTPRNWNVEQRLVIQGVDDFENDGNLSYTVRGKVVTDDIAYQNVSVPNINLLNLDDDQDAPVEWHGTSSKDYYQAKNGKDILYGDAGQDNIKGGRGDDEIYGEQDNDKLFGEEGKDSLYGMQGRDTLLGGTGKDYLDGGLGDDSMVGGAGNDTYLVDSAGDKINDQGLATDVDTVLLAQAINYTLPASVENAALNALGNANLTGNALNNNLTGNASRNVLLGGAGNDLLSGGASADKLDGGAGNDALAGCFAGANGGRNEIDTLSGGVGRDVFQLGWASGRLYDDGNVGNAGRTDYVLVTDFTAGQDRLQLDGSKKNYFLGASGVPDVTGSGLFHDTNANAKFDSTDELVAILHSANATPLNAANTVNTASFV